MELRTLDRALGQRGLEMKGLRDLKDLAIHDVRVKQCRQ